MFNKISIIGCGLIGSSIMRGVEEKKLAPWAKLINVKL